jgi:hypothetical protein
VDAVDSADSPEEKLHTFVHTHLSFFANNMDEMKVLSREADILTGDYRAEVQARKKQYVALVESIVAGLLPPDSSVRIRTATFSLFGMLNWIFTWHRPDRDPPVDELAGEMTHIFHCGLSTPREVDGTAPAPAQSTAAGPFWPET